MGILSLIKNITGKSISIQNKVIEDDTKLYSQILANYKHNLVILISYSTDYAQQMIEFLTACNAAGIRINHLQSSYETNNTNTDNDQQEESEEKEFAISPETIAHQRYYIVISGDPATNYANIYRNINALSNDILMEIQNDIYQTCSSTIFNEFINLGIMEKGMFKYKGVEPKYDEDIVTKAAQHVINANNPNVILSMLSTGFTKSDILDMLIVTIDESTSTTYKTILKHKMAETPTYKKFDFSNIFEPILGVYNKTKYEMYVGPKYAIEGDDDELDTDMDDEKLDEIFKTQYDRFYGIYNESQYTDIDEVVTDDEESLEENNNE